MIANMSEAKLIEFHKGYGNYIRTEFKLPGNDSLMESCRSYSELYGIGEIQASFIILKALQDKLQRSKVLKVVK